MLWHQHNAVISAGFLVAFVHYFQLTHKSLNYSKMNPLTDNIPVGCTYVFWPDYPSKHLQSGVYTYVKYTNHEMCDKINTFKRMTLSSRAIKQ